MVLVMFIKDDQCSWRPLCDQVAGLSQDLRGSRLPRGFSEHPPQLGESGEDRCSSPSDEPIPPLSAAGSRFLAASGRAEYKHGSKQVARNGYQAAVGRSSAWNLLVGKSSRPRSLSGNGVGWTSSAKGCPIMTLIGRGPTSSFRRVTGRSMRSICSF